jgi:hypothetical protein
MFAFTALMALAAGTSLAQAPAAGDAAAKPRDKRIVKLPSAVDDLVVGGSGRFIIAHLKSAQQLAIIDVKEAKVLKYLPFPAPNILFAAGAEHLFVALPEQNVIQRWSLNTLEKETSAPLADGAHAGTLVMGHASLGPVLLGGGEGHQNTLKLVDPKTLQAKPVDLPMGRGFECHGTCVVRASANGLVFTSWRTGSSPQGFYTLLLGGAQPESFYEHESLGLLTPSADGGRIYTGNGIYSNKAKPITAAERADRGTLWLPSVTGNYYLRVSPIAFGRSIEGNKPATLTLHLTGDTRPIVTLNGVVPARSHDFGRQSRLTLDKLILHFPDFSSLVLLSSGEDAFDIVPLDIDAELEKSGIDFLFATSQPPLFAEPGKRFEYDVAVKSKKGGVKVSLASGPEGMHVTPEGKVQWAVPAKQTGDADAILLISDASGQEVFQNFRLTIKKLTPVERTAALPRPGGGTSVRDVAHGPPPMPPAGDGPRKAASPYAALIGKTRTWTDVGTGRTLEATFVGIEDGKVKATRDGGIEISIPLDRLSREDLLWLLGASPK